MHNIDMRQLQILDDLLTLRSNAAVAAKHEITPQSISLTLGRLREIFNDSLVVRSATGWEPTPFAEEIAPTIRATLQLWLGVSSARSRFDPTVAEGTVTVGCSSLFDADGLVNLIARVNREAPGVRVSVEESANSLIDIRRVREGTLDMVCTLQAPDANATDLYCRELLNQKVDNLCCRIDHPEIGDTCSLETYAKAHHLMISSLRSGPLARSPIDAALESLGYPARRSTHVQSFLMYGPLLERTNMVGSNSEGQSRYLTRNFRVKVLPLPPELATRIPVHLVWGARTHLSPLHAWIRNLLLEMIGNVEGGPLSCGR